MLYFVSTRGAIIGVAITAFVLSAFVCKAQAAPLTLGEASRFAVLSSSAITNTGASVVYGYVGVSPAGSINGFESVAQVDGAMHLNTPTTSQAQVDLGVAYDIIAGETPTSNLTGQDLGGRTLTAGVYHFDTSAQLTGALILDAQNDPNARFDFQIGSTLTTASLATVSVTNGGNAENIYWQVGSSATLGTNTFFQGNILALTDITLTNGAKNYDGRALARNGAVTMDTNIIGVAVVPEVGTFAFLAPGVLLIAGITRRRFLSQ